MQMAGSAPGLAAWSPGTLVLSGLLLIAIALMPLGKVSNWGLVPLVLFALGAYLVAPARQHASLTRNDLPPLLAAAALAGWLLVQGYYWADTGSNVHALRILLAAPLLLLARQWLRADAFWFGCVLAALLLAGQALWQVLGQELDRAYGVYFVNLFGALAAAAGVLPFVAQPPGWTQGWRRAVLYVGLLAGGTAAVLSGSRMAVIALLAILLWHFVRRLDLRRLLAVVAVLLVLGTGLMLLPVGERWSAAMDDLHQYRGGNIITSLGMRFEMWGEAISAAGQSPLMGIGPDQFQARLQAGVAAGRWPAVMGTHTHAHNEFLNMQLTHGLPGLLALLAVLACTWQALRRFETIQPPAQAAAARAGMALILLIVLVGLTETFLIYKVMFNFYFVTLFLCLGWAGKRRDESC